MNEPKTWSEMSDHERIENLHLNLQDLIIFVNDLSRQLKTRVDKLERGRAENTAPPKQKKP